MGDVVKQADKAVAAAGDALVADVIATVRAHPQYADIVNRLTETAITAILADL